MRYETYIKKEEVVNARAQVLEMQQEVESLNNRLLGVKTQRETLSNQLDSERKIVESESLADQNINKVIKLGVFRTD